MAVGAAPANADQGFNVREESASGYPADARVSGAVGFTSRKIVRYSYTSRVNDCDPDVRYAVQFWFKYADGHYRQSGINGSRECGKMSRKARFHEGKRVKSVRVFLSISHRDGYWGMTEQSRELLNPHTR